MYKFTLALLSVFCFSFCESQVKKPITHESMWALKRVGSPEVSPDGKWVVFSVVETAYDEKNISSDLWIVPSDGSVKPRKLTFNKGAESGYKWSPDGRSIAFSAKREEDEVGQIYILNVVDGGEAQRFTNISTGASAPLWSPDGKMILFTNKVFPGNFSDSAFKKTTEERKKIKYNARMYTSFPIRDWDQWIDEKQTHPFVQSITPGDAPRDVFTNVSASIKEGWNFGGSICWSPDNQMIIFSSQTNRNNAAWQEPTSQLFKVSINGGQAVQLTNDGNDYTSPAFSPDGRYLFCQTSGSNNGRVYNLAKVARFEWPSFGNRTLLTATLDRPVNNFVATVANKLIMSVEDQGNDKILEMDAGNGSFKELTQISGSHTSVSVSNDGKVVVCSYEHASKPAEIVRINTATGMATSLTSFNDAAIAAMDLQAPETIWMTSSRGKKIRSMLIKPAGFDPAKKYPLFVVMHGGPAGSWKSNWGYRWNYHLLAAPGYVLLLTDYTGSTGYGQKFGDEIHLDPLKGPANEINEAADDVIKKYPFIDGSRQAAGGGSYGGHLANWMQATTTRYKTLISHAGMINAESQYATSDVLYGREIMNGGAPWTQTASWREQNPVRFAAKFKTPVLITVGERDYRVPLNNSIENFGILQRLKIPSKLIVFPDENHWILKGENSRFWYKEVNDWLKKYL